jgi:predicted DsbA family dithiol-disulfide isomerase
MPTDLEIYADFICPWCYIGLERLNRLEKERSVSFHWKAYLLRPDIPSGGVPLSAILSPERLQEAEATVREETRAAGLPLNRPPLVPNTHQAHEVALLADERGVGDAYHRAVFNAYFGQAQNIGDPEVLAAIGETVGMDRVEILDALRTGRYRDAVDRADRDGHERGVRGVPTFVFPSGMGFSGARPYEYFVEALDASVQASR